MFGGIAATAAVATANYFINAFVTPPEFEQHPTNFISRAIFADDRLWMLLDDGSVMSLRASEAQPIKVPTETKVLDICKSANRLLAVTVSGEQWTIQQRLHDKWDLLATLSIDGEALAAVACNADDEAVTLVTNKRLLEFNGQDVHSVSLAKPLQAPFDNGTALATVDAIWVGFNAGEWGGGLTRIDRTSGMTTVIESNKSGDTCGGPLNPGCDPVNGIVKAPWNPKCVVAAIGVLHLMSRGRIVEVCGTSVRRLFFKPLDPQPPKGTMDDGEPSSTVAFFGLARSGKTLTALSPGGYYQIQVGRRPKYHPLPKFQNRGGYFVNFDVPGFVLVVTDVNMRMSLSGSVPIIAVR